MKTITKSSLLAGVLCVMAIVFSTHSQSNAQANAQYDTNGVTITFKRPALPRGAPDPFKKFWFQKSFAAGEYVVDVKSSYPPKWESAPTPDAVYWTGSGATATVAPGYTGEVCGAVRMLNISNCFPLLNGKLNKLDMLDKVRVVKVRKNRPTNAVTVWASRDFTGRARDLGVGTHYSDDFYFFGGNSAGYNYSRPPYAVWVPAGYWVMFCREGLSDDRKLCGPGRGKRGETFFNDSPIQRAILRGSEMPKEYKYALVGTGQPPPELKPKIIMSKPFPKPKKLP